jgi:hypothetical protein
MADVLQFPYENTKEYKELKEENDAFADMALVDEYVYNSIIQNCAHVNDYMFNLDDEETMKLVALISRIHRSIALWQTGHKDPLIPFLLQLHKDLQLKKIEITE